MLQAKFKLLGKMAPVFNRDGICFGSTVPLKVAWDSIYKHEFGEPIELLLH